MKDHHEVGTQAGEAGLQRSAGQYPENTVKPDTLHGQGIAGSVVIGFGANRGQNFIEVDGRRDTVEQLALHGRLSIGDESFLSYVFKYLAKRVEICEVRQ